MCFPVRIAHEGCITLKKTCKMFVFMLCFRIYDHYSQYFSARKSNHEKKGILRVNRENGDPPFPRLKLSPAESLLIQVTSLQERR